MATASKLLSKIIGKAAYIGAGRADHAELYDRQINRYDLKLTDRHLTRLQLYFFSLSCQLIHPFTVYLDSRMCRRHLHDLSGEWLCSGPYLFLRYMFNRLKVLRLAFQIIGGSSSTQCKTACIFLFFGHI